MPSGVRQFYLEPKQGARRRKQWDSPTLPSCVQVLIAAALLTGHRESEQHR
jgi:hypothetical protein